MIDEKYYTCIKPFEVEACDGDGFMLDGNPPIEIKKGSKWFWNTSQPDYMWSSNPSVNNFIIGVDPEGEDSDYFKLTGVHRDNG